MDRHRNRLAYRLGYLAARREERAFWRALAGPEFDSTGF
jgi:hypothetical protein